MFVACMGVAGFVSVAIFPAMLAHMFSGYRGIETMDNLTRGTWLEYWERLKSFCGFINAQMFGEIGGSSMVFMLFIFVIFTVLRKGHNALLTAYDRKNLMKWLITGIPSIIYFLFVAKSAVYVSDRYLFPIYAVVFGLFWCMMTCLWKKLIEVKYVYVIMCLIGTVFIINGFMNVDWNYLYRSSSELLNRAKNYSDMNCICVYDVKWKEQPAFYELKNYKSVTFISQEHIDHILQYHNLLEDGFMLNIIGKDGEQIVNMIRKQYPYLNKCEEIGGYAYTTTYLISAEKFRP